MYNYTIFKVNKITHNIVETVPMFFITYEGAMIYIEKHQYQLKDDECFIISKN